MQSSPAPVGHSTNKQTIQYRKLDDMGPESIESQIFKTYTLFLNNLMWKYIRAEFEKQLQEEREKLPV